MEDINIGHNNCICDVINKMLFRRLLLLLSQTSRHVYLQSVESCFTTNEGFMFIYCYCETEFKTVFHRLMFWRFQFYHKQSQMKVPVKFKCFTIPSMQRNKEGTLPSDCVLRNGTSHCTRDIIEVSHVFVSSNSHS